MKASEFQKLYGSGVGNQNVGKKYENITRDSLHRSKPKRDEAQALDSADARKKSSIQRTLVRFVGYRCRPLDPDNFAGGCKDLLDGLRHAGLIHGDEPWRIRFETEQVKVRHRTEEKTVIVIDESSS